MRRLFPLVIAVQVAACGTGAVHPLTFITPDVHLHHLAFRNAGLEGGTLDLVLAFYNPDKLSLQGTHIKARIDIEGNHFGDAELSDPFTLAAEDTTLVTLPLDFRWSAVAAAARSVLDYGTVNYTISGRFGVITPMCSECDIPFSGQGKVPLLRP